MLAFDKSELYPFRPIYFDIETAPLDEDYIRSIAPEFEAPKNYKSEEAIEKYCSEKLGEYIASGALRAETGKVIAISVAIGDEAPQVLIDTENEAELIKAFWDFITDDEGMITRKIIGFNSNNFDIPFLTRRSWINGIEVPNMVYYRRSGRKFLNDFFKDVMLEWSCGQMQYIGLDRLSKILSVGKKNGDGALFYKQLEVNRQEAIDYAKNDVVLTRACAKKLFI
jgi:predicted PolB exonuclease-like 3'-5' exonuclease